LIGASVGIFACLLLVFAICWIAFPFPLEQFAEQDDSIFVTDRDGRVLLELAGRSEQRRRSIPLSQMSEWLPKAAIAVEDERFRSHWGVDFLAIFRATGQNLFSRRLVSGASTITMQVCKMMDERPRTWQSKLIESFRALQLERQKSKPEILTAYLNRIPCGGNLCGVESASQAYFGKSAASLSLGEAALLAGLPQSPNRFAPDRHPEAARRRRETVLKRMLELKMISETQRDQALMEPIEVDSRFPKQPEAVHAAWMAFARWKLRASELGGDRMQPSRRAQIPSLRKIIRTTIDLDLQSEVQ
jgi:penicillin-binding protein 1C